MSGFVPCPGEESRISTPLCDNARNRQFVPFAGHDGAGSEEHSIGSPAVRELVVLGLTILVIVLSAILLPPNGTSAMPQDESRMGPATTPR
jgi:hypothetical protein